MHYLYARQEYLRDLNCAPPLLHVKTNSSGGTLKGTVNSIKISDDASHMLLKISFALQASWDSHYDDDDGR